MTSAATSSEVPNEEVRHAARLMVFQVDDGLFGIHVNWVRSVQEQELAPIHTVRATGNRTQSFLLLGNEVAFVYDLRELLGLHDVLGSAERPLTVVVRSGSHLIAIPADSCVGIQEIDLRDQTPVPTSLTRDGGISVGHILEHGSEMLVILDPNRLLDAEAREALDPAAREAQGFVERMRRIETLWTNIRVEPTLSDLRNFGRLCKRNGRARTVAALRPVVKYLEAPTANADSAGEAALREILRLAGEKFNGEVKIQRGESEETGRIFFRDGRVIDSLCQKDSGRRAFRKILEWRDGTPRESIAGPITRNPRIAESTIALVVSSLEVIGEERRGRRDR